jgi:hypothetical protein
MHGFNAKPIADELMHPQNSPRLPKMSQASNHLAAKRERQPSVSSKMIRQFEYFSRASAMGARIPFPSLAIPSSKTYKPIQAPPLA